MAIIKRLLTWLFVLIVLLGLVGLFLPDHAQVERSTIIEREPEQVFALLNSFERFNEWSPWARLDPNTQYQFSGPARGVGAAMSWQSEDASVGSGRQEIVESVAHERIKTVLDFGDMGTTEATFTLEPVARGTRVTWRFDADFGYNLISRYAGLLFDSMVGRSYETGLASMKALLEAEAPVKQTPELAAITDAEPVLNTSTLEVEEITVESQRIAFVSMQTSTNKDDIAAAMSDAYGRVFTHLGELGIVPAGPPFTIAHRWDPQANVFEFDAGVPVPDATLNDPEAEIRISDHYQGPALRIEYKGSYQGLETVHEFLAKVIQSRELTIAGSPWEVYLNSPDEVSESELVTHIYYPVSSISSQPEAPSPETSNGSDPEPESEG